jgi:uncharacterized phage-associated protein
MKNINHVCDYVIFRITSEGNASLSHLKLQKLLYYCQSWFLAYEKNKLFDGKFQAWIHGPVNRQIYDRFKDTKYIYSLINMTDVKEENLSFPTLTELEKVYINAVLETYAPFSDGQLETMTHNEKPWIDAREGYEPFQRCEEEINETTMETFYATRIFNGKKKK